MFRHQEINSEHVCRSQTAVKLDWGLGRTAVKTTGQFRAHCFTRLRYTRYTWWCHKMETFSALLAICAGNSPVTGEIPAQRPVTRGFDVSFDLHMNKRLSKQSRGWWFETPWRPLWRQSNDKERIKVRGFCNKPSSAQKLIYHQSKIPSIDIEWKIFPTVRIIHSKTVGDFIVWELATAVQGNVSVEQRKCEVYHNKSVWIVLKAPDPICEMFNRVSQSHPMQAGSNIK